MGSNKDYSNYTIIEAIEAELFKNFADLIKLLDSKVIAARLHAIMCAGGHGMRITDMIGQFNALGLNKTSVD